MWATAGGAVLATLRQRQGRAVEAIVLCAIGAAEAAGEERALAHACYVLDWALVESGCASQAGHSERALAIYRGWATSDARRPCCNTRAASPRRPAAEAGSEASTSVNPAGAIRFADPESLLFRAFDRGRPTTTACPRP